MLRLHCEVENVSWDLACTGVSRRELSDAKRHWSVYAVGGRRMEGIASEHIMDSSMLIGL